MKYRTCSEPFVTSQRVGFGWTDEIKNGFSTNEPEMFGSAFRRTEKNLRLGICFVIM